MQKKKKSTHPDKKAKKTLQPIKKSEPQKKAQKSTMVLLKHSLRSLCLFFYFQTIENKLRSLVYFSK